MFDLQTTSEWGPAREHRRRGRCRDGGTVSGSMRRLRSLALAAVIAASGLVLAGPTAASASTPETVSAGSLATTGPLPTGVQAPYQCPSPLPWSSFYIRQNLDEKAAVDDLAVRDTFDATGFSAIPFAAYAPHYLGLSVPASDGVSINDQRAVSGERFDVVMVIPPQHAQDFRLERDGSWAWNPVAGHLGGDSFTYAMLVGADCLDVATVTIPPPIFERVVDDHYSVYNDQLFVPGSSTCFNKATIAGRIGSDCGMMRNDIAFSPVITIKPVNSREIPGTPPGAPMITSNGGTVVFQPNGYFTYLPPSGYVGEDSFVYYLDSVRGFRYQIYGSQSYGNTDPRSGGAKVTFDVKARPLGSAPKNPDFLSTLEDTSITITPSTLTTNDAPGTGNIISLNSSDADTIRTQHGTLAVTWNEICGGLGACFKQSVSNVVYTPDPDYFGPDEFAYATSDTPGGFIPGTVYIDVTSVIDRPVAKNISFSMQAKTTGTFDFLANDFDPDDQVVRSLTTAGPFGPGGPNGVFVNNADGTFTYTPDGSGESFNGQVFRSFLYETIDVNGLRSNALATFAITPNPAVDDAYTTDEDVPLVVGPPGVLANDDPGGAAVLTSGPANGTIVLDADGSFTYTPAADFFGTDSFVYRSSDDDGTVMITVDPVEDAPSIALNTTCVSTADATCIGDFDNRGNVNEGAAARLRGFVADPEYTAGTLRIDWGDGSTTSVDYPCAEGASPCAFGTQPTYSGTCGGILNLPCPADRLFFDLSHVYADNPRNGERAGPYTVTASATSVDELTATPVNGTAVIKDVASTIAISPNCSSELCIGSFSVLRQAAGGSVRVAGRVTDPGIDTGRLSIDWGDGSAQVVDLSCGGSAVCPATPLHAGCSFGTVLPSCGYFSFTHTYPSAFSSPTHEDDTYEVTVTATTDVDPIDQVTPGAVTTAAVTTSVAVLVDDLPPTADPAPTVPAGASGVHSGDVTVEWNWTDSGSGIDPEQCTTTSTSSGTGDITLQATCTDRTGNEGSASFTVRVVVPVVVPPAGGGGSGGGAPDTPDTPDTPGAPVPPVPPDTPGVPVPPGAPVPPVRPVRPVRPVPPVVVPPSSPPGFVTIPPRRVLDTRDQAGFRAQGQVGASPAGTSITIPLTGSGVPADATAVVVNVTATRAQARGYLVVHACDTARPDTSNVMYLPGVNGSTLAIAPISAAGTICLYASSRTDVVVDVFAFSISAPDSGALSATARRLVDTRTTAQPAGGSTTRVRLPAGAAHAVTVTAVRAVDRGFVAVHDCATPRPATSTVNYDAGAPTANLAIVTGTELCVFTSTRVDIIVDHVGTLTDIVIEQTRLLDTRAKGAPPKAGSRVEIPLPTPRVPGAAAFLNITTTGTLVPGHLSIHDCGAPAPQTSNINSRVGYAVANLAITAPTGRVCITTTTTTHLIVDLVATQR